MECTAVDRALNVDHTPGVVVCGVSCATDLSLCVEKIRYLWCSVSVVVVTVQAESTQTNKLWQHTPHGLTTIKAIAVLLQKYSAAPCISVVVADSPAVGLTCLWIVGKYSSECFQRVQVRLSVVGKLLVSIEGISIPMQCV